MVNHKAMISYCLDIFSEELKLKINMIICSVYPRDNLGDSHYSLSVPVQKLFP